MLNMRIIQVIIALVAVLIILPTISAADPGNFSSLNSSAQATESGGTLTLDKNYTYDNGTDSIFGKNGISITKDLIIDGNGFVLDAQNSTGVFNVGDNVKLTLKNLFIKNTINGAIFLGTGSELDVINCTFLVTKGNGIEIENSNHVNILNTYIEALNGIGLLIKNSTDINIQNVTVKNSGVGISIENSKDVLVTGSKVMSNSASGINIEQSENVTVSDSSIENNQGNGITLKNTVKTIISNNQINNNDNGIYFGPHVNDTSILCNNINDNIEGGISFAESGSNTVVNKNIISGNYDGLNLDSTSDNLIITQNFITKNTHAGIRVGQYYIETSTAKIEYNRIYGNKGYGQIQNKFSTATSFGYNWLGANTWSGVYNQCPCGNISKLIQVKIIQTNLGVFQAVFYAGKEIASLLPEVNVLFRLNNGLGTTVITENGVATFPFSSSKYTAGSNELMAIADDQQVTLAITPEDLDKLKDYERNLPVADFTTSITQDLPPLTVQFMNASTGNGTLTFYWDFGDGQTSTEQNPMHIYSKAGIYRVNLTVTNKGYYTDVISKNVYINYVYIEPVGGTYNYPQIVNLISDDPNAVIYYTTDGSDPTVNSAIYSDPIVINSNMTLKYVAVTPANNWSSIYTQIYIINIVTPVDPVTPVTPDPVDPGSGGTGGSGGNSDNGGTGGSGSNPGSNGSNSSNNNSSKSNIPPIAGFMALTATLTGTEPSAGQDGSDSETSSQSSSKTTKELFVDDKTQNSSFWGVIGVIVLFIVTFGFYYRKDLMEMIKKSK